MKPRLIAELVRLIVEAEAQTGDFVKVKPKSGESPVGGPYVGALTRAVDGKAIVAPSAGEPIVFDEDDFGTAYKGQASEAEYKKYGEDMEKMTKKLDKTRADERRAPKRTGEPKPASGSSSTGT